MATLYGNVNMIHHLVWFRDS